MLEKDSITELRKLTPFQNSELLNQLAKELEALRRIAEQAIKFRFLICRECSKDVGESYGDSIDNWLDIRKEHSKK